MMLTAIRVARIRICGDFLELYDRKPVPKDQGPGLLVWRDKGHREATVLMSGLTPFGIEETAKAFREKGIDPTGVIFEQDRLKQIGRSQIKIKRLSKRSKRFLLENVH